MTMLRLMFTIFMVAGNFILLNMFISVINEGLSYMHENPEKAEFDVELSEYLKVNIVHFIISFIFIIHPYFHYFYFFHYFILLFIYFFLILIFVILIIIIIIIIIYLGGLDQSGLCSGYGVCFCK